MSAAEQLRPSAFDRLAARLAEVTGQLPPNRDGSAMVRCPAHEDGQASLSVTRGDGKVLMYCQAGCSTDSVLVALGMKAADLFDADAARPKASDRKEQIATYRYVDESGELLSEVVRYLPKGFRQRRPDPSKRGGWAWSLGDVRRVLFRLPEVLEAVSAGRTIWVTEGEKDVLALERAGLVATCNLGGAGKWRAEYSESLSGATVVVVVDNDTPGAKHAVEVVQSLAAAGCTVSCVRARAGKDAADHLAAGHSVDDFEPVAVDALMATVAGEAVTDELAPAAPASNVVSFRRRSGGGGGDEQGAVTPRFFVGADGGTYTVNSDTGSVRRLANFSAVIVRQSRIDYGENNAKPLPFSSYELEVRMGDELVTAHVPVAEFRKMEWVPEHLGAGAIVDAGQQTRDLMRAAIQTLSTADGVPPTHQTFGHTGWRDLPGIGPAFLHAGGALTAAGPIDSIETELPSALEDYDLPAPAVGPALAEAVSATLATLELAPDRAMAPMLGALFRAVLGPSTFTTYVVGPSGAHKSSLAALLLQHFGSRFAYDRLPATFASTSNAVEHLTWAAADVPFLVDDFAPDGTVADVGRLHAQAARTLRGVGNNSGRGRLTRDSTYREARKPRCTLLVTGEDVPRGQSVQARALVIELAKGDAPLGPLIEASRVGDSGTYAEGMAAFICWLAARRDGIDSWRHGEVIRLRSSVASTHDRTATTVAELAAGWEVWLSFALDTGALAADQVAAVWHRVWAALVEAGRAQVSAAGTSDPAARFRDLIASALASGRAHITDMDGRPPRLSPRTWGWVEEGTLQQSLRAPGRRIGWLDEDSGDLFLDPAAAYAEAEGLARAAGDSLAITDRMLWKHLKGDGWLLSTEPEHLAVRKRIDGGRHRVLHLSDRFVVGNEQTGPGTATTPPPAPHVDPVGFTVTLPTSEPHETPADGPSEADSAEDAYTIPRAEWDALAARMAALEEARWADVDERLQSAGWSESTDLERAQFDQVTAWVRDAETAPPEPLQPTLPPALQPAPVTAGPRRPAHRPVSTRRVGVTDGERLWLTAGKAVPIARPGHAGELAEVLIAAGIRECWLLPSALAAWGLPAELPALRSQQGHPHPFVTDALATWEVGGPTIDPKGLMAWLPMWRSGEDGSVDLVVAAYDRGNPFHGVDQADELLELLDRFRALTGGVSFYRSGAITSDKLVRAVHAAPRAAKVRVAEHPPPARPERRGAGAAGAELDIHWGRLPTGDEAAAAHAHAFDLNAAYLGAASSLALPTGPAAHAERPAFDHTRPAYWLVDLLDGPPAELLPDPFRPQPSRHGDVNRRWVTTPTAVLLDEVMGKGTLTPLEVWWWDEHHRYLSPWYTRLRDARTAVLEDGGPLLDAVKQVYRQGVGRLESTRRKDPAADPLYQPYWRHAVIAQTRANLWRRLRKLTAQPVAVDVDGVWFLTDDDDADRFASSIGLPIGSGLGQFKHSGSGPAAAAVEALSVASSDRLAAGIARLREVTG